MDYEYQFQMILNTLKRIEVRGENCKTMTACMQYIENLIEKERESKNAVEDRKE